MRIEDVLTDPNRRDHFGKREVVADALTADDALQEAQLQRCRIDAVNSEAWFLFDCRGALQLRSGNTAVIVAHDVDHLSWRSERRPGRTAWSVVGSQPLVDENRWVLKLEFVPDARLEVQARAAEFFLGDVPGMDAPQPNYIHDDDETVEAGLARWTSPFEVREASFLDWS
jgi:hypothetical protein